jgi:hypothetical protein
MSLEKWVEYGWLRREPTSTGEIKDLLGIVDRSLADSKVEAVSTDLEPVFCAVSIQYSHPLYWRPADRLHGYRGGA